MKSHHMEMDEKWTDGGFGGVLCERWAGIGLQPVDLNQDVKREEREGAEG